MKLQGLGRGRTAAALGLRGLSISCAQRIIGLDTAGKLEQAAQLHRAAR